MPPPPITVVGAGLAGLTAALELARAGRDVTVVDKGARVGGRLGTREVAGAVCDTGAQFCTARSDAFRSRIEGWVGDGLVFEWARGFRGEDDGHPRYAVRGGFRQLGERLAAEATAAGAIVRTGVELGEVRGDEGPVVLTPPLPQALALLGAGRVELDPAVVTPLSAIEYTPTTSLQLVLDGPSSVPPPGGVQLDAGPFSFVADNQQKGIADRPALTLHTTDRADAGLDELVDLAARWVGDARVVEADLKRWRYAQPTSSFPERCAVVASDPYPIVLAGDAYGGPRVEGAFLSGLAAAAVLGGS